MGKTKHSPSVHAATPTAERGGSSELLCPRLQRSAGHCQVWLPNPSTGEKQDLKKQKNTTPLLWFLYQSPSTCCRRQREAARCGEETQQKQTAVYEAEKPGEGKPHSAPMGSAPAWPGKPGIGTWCWRTPSLSKPAPEWACIAGMLGLSEGGPGIAGRFLNT